MSEVTIVNLFTVVRVVLIGGMLMVLPRITRKGLLFGVYVGEACSDGDAARSIVRRWNLGCLVLIALSIAIGLGISYAGWPLAGNLTATAFLMVLVVGLYLRSYSAAKELASPESSRQAEFSVAALGPGEPKGAALARTALVLALLAGVATVAYATLEYPALPDRVPTHFGPSGHPDAWSNKSMATVLLVPALNLVICPFIALMALLTTRAKRSIRGGSGGRSAEAQEGFRAAIANVLSVTALFVTALMTFISVQSIRVGLSRSASLGDAVWWITGAMLLFLIGSLIWIMVRYGQGGALLEVGSSQAPLTNGIADNAHWIWGVFYVNKDDASILVEKRFGLGYTINFGNWKAVAMLVTFLVLTLGLTVIGLIAAAA